MTPFFSIIIPTLNEELFLPKLLKNLTEQNEKNFEVIVVDAKSTDSTEKQALAYSAKLPLKFIQGNQKNVSYQRNLGVSQARGQYIIFLDADVTIKKTFTKVAQNQIEKNKGLVFIPYVMPEEKKEFAEISYVFPFLNKLIEISQNFDKPFSAGGCMIWERNFFKILGGFDEEIFVTEDHNIIRKARTWGVKPKVIPSLKIIFSVRRMKKEGKLKIFYKFIVSHFYLLFNKKLNKKIFEYSMGGHLYNKNNPIATKKKNTFTTKKFLKNTEKFFKSLLTEE